VKVGQKEQGGTTSEHDSGKGGDKEHGHVHGQVHHVKEEKKPIETRQARHDGHLILLISKYFFFEFRLIIWQWHKQERMRDERRRE
jgi:hypothetical protein